jgi:hypothetical protein
MRQVMLEDALRSITIVEQTLIPQRAEDLEGE